MQSFTPLQLALIGFELVVLVVSISLHDCAQAWMAARLGDPTARMVGRVSLSPARHFDPFGTVLWPLLSLFLFRSLLPYGWGRPVPMTYRNFPKKNGEVLAILAGPAAQLLAALLALVLLVLLKHLVPGTDLSIEIASMVALRVPVDGLASAPGIFPLLLLLYFGIMLNLFLCVFNLLPMPFLDGGKILAYFLPYNLAQAFERNSLWFMVAFFLLGGRLVGIVFGPLLAVFTVLLGRL